MKKLLLILLCMPMFILSTLCIAQTSSLTLSASKDAMIREYNGIGDGNNYGTVQYLNMHAWTNGGIPVTHRSLIDFDLSTIPSNSFIQSAFLFLYVDINVNTFPGGHYPLSGSNECIIKRVITNWNEISVTWNNQPGTTTSNQTNIPQSTASNQDYIIDVTNLIQDMNNDTLNSFGFLIKLINENYYRRMIFASKDNPNREKHPKLQVTYMPNNTTTSWDCVGNSCVDPGTGLGMYATQFACNSVCAISSVEEHNTNKKLLKITDLLGRETKQTNQPLFYIYDDGTVEQRIIME